LIWATFVPAETRFDGELGSAELTVEAADLSL